MTATTRTSGTGEPRRGAADAAGFTLVEVIVALTLGALVMTSAYTAFTVVVSASRRLEGHADLHQRARALCATLERDVRMARPGPRGAATGPGRFEVGRMEFRTRGPAGEPGAVRYEARGEALVRTWTPEQGEGGAVTAVVAEPIGALAFSYDDAAPGQALAAGVWPRAVTIEVRLREDAAGPELALRRRIRLECDAAPAPRVP